MIAGVKKKQTQSLARVTPLMLTTHHRLELKKFKGQKIVQNREHFSTPQLSSFRNSLRKKYLSPRKPSSPEENQKPEEPKLSHSQTQYSWQYQDYISVGEQQEQSVLAKQWFGRLESKYEKTRLSYNIPIDPRLSIRPKHGIQRKQKKDSVKIKDLKEEPSLNVSSQDNLLINTMSIFQKKNDFKLASEKSELHLKPELNKDRKRFDKIFSSTTFATKRNEKKRFPLLQQQTAFKLNQPKQLQKENPNIKTTTTLPSVPKSGLLSQSQSIFLHDSKSFNADLSQLMDVLPHPNKPQTQQRKYLLKMQKKSENNLKQISIRSFTPPPLQNQFPYLGPIALRITNNPDYYF